MDILDAADVLRHRRVQDTHHERHRGGKNEPINMVMMMMMMMMMVGPDAAGLRRCIMETGYED